ncbi:hypothetical protein [Cryobacterium ruanii]|uniref:Uncharacterized protein n=1 Tax=Cryobacterium ruanii TaxID=1259197 RepID=A0A4R9APV1_9MICO|nr:hypothetical protein [Cryobacterium ruanii]TFD67793.1 hypothetical protein E3T47_04045 [Cryobacterium ruanii]
MTERREFAAAVNELALSFERGTSIYRPFVRVLRVGAASVCTLGAPFGSETICASTPLALTFDELQLGLGKGPSWDAMITRHAVLIDDLHAVRHAPWLALPKGGTTH